MNIAFSHSAMSPMAANDFFSPPPSSSGGGDSPEIPDAWYGNIQYLLNISAIGLLCCVSIFFLVKLRSDHHRMPGPSAIFSKLLAVWKATCREIARHCGADAAQFLLIEGGSFVLLFSVAILAVSVMLPLNLYAGTAMLNDELSKTMITHIKKGSGLLWVHFAFVVIVVLLAHFGISAIEGRLKFTRFRDGNGNLSDPNTSSTALFTIMVQGLPKTLGSDRSVFEEYFREKYPGKVFKIIIPMDLCALDDLATELVRVRDDITWLVARMDSRLLPEEIQSVEHGGLLSWVRILWMKVKVPWSQITERMGFTDEEKLRQLQELRAELETQLSAYKEGRAQCAGVAFVVFKDVYTANKAIQDFRTDRSRRFGKFFSVTELRLQRNQWKVERSPLATDIYWNNLGLTKFSCRMRRVIVNSILLLMLVFFSSPLALISALISAGRIINAEAVDNAQSWFTWVQTSGWIGSLIFQFLPNVIIFISMYIIIPSVLSYFSKFERHLTVSGEQRAALLKMVCFFLVNLIVLKALVESSLETALLKMGRCYLDGEDCKRIEEYMSPSFLSRSCLSALAFLITSTFLGISFDLLAPIPWIKKKIQRFRKNDMLQLVPEQNEEYPLENQDTISLQTPLIPDNTFESPGLLGHDLAEYPISRTSPIPKQKFDFAQYYAFNLTIFALTMIYSALSPLVVPVGAVYFGYRYIVDKYNFLFVYRVRGFPSGNEGKLMDTVFCIMRFCVDLFLVSMLLFFWVKGDSTKLQAIFTLGVLVMYKLLPSDSDRFHPALLRGFQTVDDLVDGPIDYELYSRPNFDWDTHHR
ncbi:PREDICTED: CSC1-like protein At4g35870 [Tarenaya hassleriana]|uniref:CSC1-like protein At4g35870 n=1 Tax=Tarenaya hassleriana TaxID=28532 RepID=UPI00053CA890|nr:PREDICTED: CSC1-like protein At4g35870 [Tarenaya hassleriana]